MSKTHMKRYLLYSERKSNLKCSRENNNQLCGHRQTRATAAPVTVTAMMMAVAAAAGALAMAAGGMVAMEMANAKQTVEVKEKNQQSTIKKKKIGSKDDGRSVAVVVRKGQQCGTAAVVAKATVEGNG
jgi:hypothetical protein